VQVPLDGSAMRGWVILVLGVGLFACSGDGSGSSSTGGGRGGSLGNSGSGGSAAGGSATPLGGAGGTGGASEGGAGAASTSQTGGAAGDSTVIGSGGAGPSGGTDGEAGVGGHAGTTGVAGAAGGAGRGGAVGGSQGGGGAGGAAGGGSGMGTTTTLYIHGRNPGGLPVGWSYWLAERPGINAVPVNWVGSDPIAETNATIRSALDTYCTGNNWCYVACHSAGCAQIGYALALYGTTGDVDSWNIYWIAAAGSAEGGSELAALSDLIGGVVPLDEDLAPSVIRQMYDHDATNGVTHWMFAGSGYSDSEPQADADGALLPGDDDLVVSYHSSCGVNNTAYADTPTWCNSTDFVCTGNSLDLGSHSYLFQQHVIQFLDTAGDYSHFIGDSNEGICSRMFLFMGQNAL
jgi:hypothetical protein